MQVSSSSCIVLIFTNQPNLSVKCGVHACLHPNRHHQVIHSSFYLNISYPPPYQRRIWDYKKADLKNIQKDLDLVNWERLFDQKDSNAQFVALSETILSISRSYVPNKYITIDNKDPVWMNETIKSKTKAKKALYKKYIQNGRFESDFVYLTNVIIELN